MESPQALKPAQSSPKLPVSSAVSENIQRLAEKPGVTATLAIERTSKQILQSTGNLFSLSAFGAERKVTTFSPSLVGTAPSNSNDLLHTGDDIKSDGGIEALAALIVSYVDSTGFLVQQFDKEDDVKLLRLRTKRHEFVIVPDTKFIFVVVHDTHVS